jgi:putative nucleotidyltransferase with HDIG domain
VARLARRLAVELQASSPLPPDVQLVEAGALLHDIAKASSFGTGLDHAVAGAHRLRSLGLPQVADIVERHVHLGEWKRSGPVTEAEILNYSDKRVLHEEVVSLDRRFRDLIVRYGKDDPVTEEAIRANWTNLQDLERKIFRHLSWESEDLK